MEQRAVGRWHAEKRLQGLTELEAVNAQAGICGVVQPSFLSPAAGGVRVHLSGCNTCRMNAMNENSSLVAICLFRHKVLQTFCFSLRD